MNFKLLDDFYLHNTIIIIMYSINQSDNKRIPNNLYNFILFSLIIHIFIILALSIKWYTNIRHSTKAIDITLVTEQSKNKPKKADFLAQNNQQGGGESNKKNNPSTNEQALFPDQLDKTINKKAIAKTLINDLNKALNKKSSFLTTNNDSNNIANINKEVNNSKLEQKETADFIIQIEQIPEMTSLIRNIELRKKLYAKRPKIRYVTAETAEYRDAVYLDKWRRKIEYVGNKYYPEPAKKRNLSGKVILLVAINSNGQIKKVKIEKSSGIKVLDTAAVQTIHLAAPFEPFTKAMRKDTDVLQIVRTWSFNEDGENKGLAVYN